MSRQHWCVDTYVCDRNGLDKGGHKIDHNYETHRETTETAKLLEEYQFAQVMHGRVDPATTLREQDPPIIRSYRVRVRVTNKLSLEVREVLEE